MEKSSTWRPTAWLCTPLHSPQGVRGQYPLCRVWRLSVVWSCCHSGSQGLRQIIDSNSNKRKQEKNNNYLHSHYHKSSPSCSLFRGLLSPAPSRCQAWAKGWRPALHRLLGAAVEARPPFLWNPLFSASVIKSINIMRGGGVPDISVIERSFDYHS